MTSRLFFRCVIAYLAVLFLFANGMLAYGLYEWWTS